jgi:hypothetical protein
MRIWKSLDCWCFTLVIGGYALGVGARFDLVAGAISLLFAAIAIALYWFFPAWRRGLIVIALAALALAPMLLAMYLRHSTAPHAFAHDGLVQVEAAIQFLLIGKNPYREDYFATPLAQWWVPMPGEPVNPALYHLIYLPGMILVPAPFYLAMQLILGWFDLRIVFLGVYGAWLALIPRLTRGAEKKRALILLAGLNPLLLPFLIEGRNDVVVLFWITLCIGLLQAERRIGSALALALACASKLTAWFILPFYAIYLIRASPRIFDRRVWMPLAIFVVAFSAIVLPFALWDARALIDDVFLYASGATEFAYPIKSLGWGGIALAFGWIPNERANAPFTLLQIIFGAPTLVWLGWLQLRRNSIRAVWLNYAALTLVIAFFSRVFNDNHLGYITSLFILGMFTET